MQVVEVKWVDAEHYTEHWPDEWEGDVTWVKNNRISLKGNRNNPNPFNVYTGE